MKTLLFILIATIYVGSTVFAQTQKGLDIDGEAAFDWSGWSVSMPDTYTVAIGAFRNDGNGTDAGHVRIYAWNGTNWIQKGIDIDGEAAGDWLGYSVNMPDANTVAIGALQNDGNGSNAGHVRIYTWNGTAWVQKGTDIDGEAASDGSGFSVSMPDANSVAIGARYNDGNGSNAGHTRIYTWNGTAWVQKGVDIDSEGAGDESGYSVSMPDANTVAIGARFNNNGNGADAGHTRIYAWNGTNWIQKGIDIDGEAAEDRSGHSVSMPDANTVAIGAYLNDGNGNEAGHTRIYAWNGTAWVQKGIDIDGEAAGDWLGASVSMPNANIVAIGARFNNNGNGADAGHTRIYAWNGTAWVQKGLDIDGEASNDQSGISVSMPDANTVAIGAYANGGNGNGAGHVRVYCMPSEGTDVQTACDSYTWIDGNTYTASNNTATWTLTNAAGCDSVVTLDLTINNSNTGTDVITACDTYTWIDGNTYSASNNTATHTLTNVAGCDSIVTLDLTINNSNTGTDVQTACDSYTWIDGNTYTASNNTATHTLTNVAGCDSIVTLDLTINSSNTGTDVQIACDTYTWIDGNTYSASNNTATHTLTNIAGCDSVVTLDLTINNSNTGTDVITACDTYTWIDGNTYTASNNLATHTLINVAGCDSIVTLDLTINNSNTGTDVITACDTYTWIDGNTYMASNNSATHTLTNIAGCDSVVTLDLTINLIPNNNVTETGALLEADQTGATYQWLDCDDNYSIINTATNQAYTPAVSGNYAVEIMLNGCTDTSLCYLVDYTGIKELEAQVISIHPNPTSNMLFISGLDQVSGVQRMEILSVTGKVVSRMEGLNEQIDVAKLPNGVYILKILHETRVESIRFVKQ